jgi:PKD repeat protein
LKLVWKCVFALTVLLLVSSPLLAQNYPMPTKVGEQQTVCTGCAGTNSAGEPNSGKPTYQYNAPLSDFVGRFHDSNSTKSVQNKGMRTLRAGKVRMAGQRGTAPPRIYIQMGETFAAYGFDSFFSRLGEPLTAVNQIDTPNRIFPWGGRTPFEQILMLDAYFYPEGSAANWQVPLADNQDRLRDFDWDDRGNIYVAEDEFGWGLIKDSGQSNAAVFTNVFQILDDASNVTPTTVIHLKSGSEYYAFTSFDGADRVAKYNVTNVSAPAYDGVRVTTNGSTGILRWAKDDTARVLAVVNRDKKLRLYDYDAYINGTGPMAVISPIGSGATVKDAAFDDKGDLWVLESSASGLPTSSNAIHKLTKTSGYSDTVISNAFTGTFFPVSLHANQGYVAVAGLGAGYIGDVYLFKINGSSLQLLDTDGFFRKFYHSAPSGYAEPGIYTDTPQNEIRIIKNGTKTYLFYSPFGMGDVFQLEGSGPSVTATMKTTSFGTVNPNAQSTLTGPFVGDPVTFRATTTSPTAQAVDWNFGNPEAGGTTNIRSGTTGVDIVHQYTGLNTTTKVTTAKTVTVSFTSDPGVNNSISVSLKVPEPRIALKATGGLVTASDFNVLIGDKFVDASDGSVEGHYASWTVGPTGSPATTNALPSAEIPVGAALGAHAVQYSGFYGKYDGSFNLSSPFVTSLPSRTYTVLPFYAKLTEPVRSGANVTYGATARFTTDTQFLNAANWTYRWALTTANGTETASLTDSVPVGTTIPPFTFTKALLVAANGGKVTLTLTVSPGAVPSASQFEVFSVFAPVTVPSPVIVPTGCTNASGPCSLLATAASGTTDGWQLSWSVEHNSTVVKTGTGNPLVFNLPASSGTYLVTVTETVYDVVATKTLNVAATLCGPPPTIAQMSISPSCLSQCPTGTAITFTAAPFGYTLQDCDLYSWTFGDGGTGSGRVVPHTYSTSGNKTVTLKVSNSSNPTGTTFTETVNVGGITQSCDAPVGISFTTNCVSGSTCKAGTSVQFVGHRGLGGLLSCDNASWTFGDGGTSSAKSPTHTYANPGTYNVHVTVTNTSGNANYDESIVIMPGTTSACNGSASEANVTLSFSGATSGCSSGNSTRCTANESVSFNAGFFNYTQQSCDKFEWNFGDGGTSTSKSIGHAYTANGTYTVTLRVYNTANPTGVTITDTVEVGPVVPAKPVPVLAFSAFPTTGSKGAAVTFTVNADRSATGWSWDFGDGVKDTTSQASIIGTSTSIQHTYANAGTYAVSVKARNSEDVPSAQTGSAVAIPGIVISDVPEYKYLLPVVTHGPGQNNSVWRTDVQIYTPDSSVTPQHPLVMTAQLRDIQRPLEVFNSTFYYEDFMRVFTTATDSGPVIITVRTQQAPQIWTRTYNQTDTGTFGQYIPAIRIDAAAGAGSAFGSGKYYMAGLRHDSHFRTNLGFLNPNAQTINATVKVYDDTQSQVGQFTLQLPPFQLDQFPITAAKAVPLLSPDHPFSISVEVPPGQWVIGYASYIDNASGDPVYIQAVRESELSLTDYSAIVVPGVGHVGEWRSDITIYNPDTQSVNVDLTYHDQTGAKVAETKNVLIHPREFLSYTDFLKQGILGNVPDSLGILRVNVNGPFPPATYPLAFARTYNDKGTGKTFGQGINGFAAARANVKPGKPALVPGIRSNTKYYTNVGLTNVSGVPVTAVVKFLDPTSGAEQVIQTHNLQPNQSVVGRVIMPSQLESGSLKIEVTGGNVWAFGSIVDVGTADPEYVAATPLVP